MQARSEHSSLSCTSVWKEACWASLNVSGSVVFESLIGFPQLEVTVFAASEACRSRSLPGNLFDHGYHLRGISSHDGTLGDVLRDDASCGDDGVGADLHAIHDDGPGTDEAVVKELDLPGVIGIPPTF